MKLFSVIIPTFNRAALLRHALISVLAQDLADFEILVVDDGSSDDTATVASSFGNQVRCFSQQNRGPGAARNLAVEHAGGRYIAFLDSDDLFFSWSLSAYAKVIRANQEPAFIAGKPKLFDNVEELYETSPESIAVHRFSDYLTSGDKWRWWGASSFVIRRDQFLAAGGFANEPINGEDADLALKLGVAPGFIQMTRPETFAYRKHAANVMKNAARNVSGARYQVSQEHAGVYPGQRGRARERRRIITRHVRPATCEGLKAGLPNESWRLYKETFHWNVALGHWKYLLGFPVLAASRSVLTSRLKLRQANECRG
jgi:glycosyltransferase involved in cell wall biosynthesis